MCIRVLPLFRKLRQRNLHVNCHVNGTTFQSGLRFQTGLSSLRFSCINRTVFHLPVLSSRSKSLNIDLQFLGQSFLLLFNFYLNQTFFSNLNNLKLRNNIILHSHKKQIVWKHEPNWPFYTFMLRTKLY